MTGSAKESRARAIPPIRRRIVVGIAVAVDIAHVGSRTAHDGTKPPSNVLNKAQRDVILPLSNEFHTLSCALYELRRRFHIIGDAHAPAYLDNAKINQALQVLQ